MRGVFNGQANPVGNVRDVRRGRLRGRKGRAGGGREQPHVEVHRLFVDPNGYAVYRFYDLGEPRYYVVAPGGRDAQVLPPGRKKAESLPSDMDGSAR